jgi:hypothetical protein
MRPALGAGSFGDLIEEDFIETLNLNGEALGKWASVRLTVGEGEKALDLIRRSSQSCTAALRIAANPASYRIVAAGDPECDSPRSSGAGMCSCEQLTACPLGPGRRSHTLNRPHPEPTGSITPAEAPGRTKQKRASQARPRMLCGWRCDAKAPSPGRQPRIQGPARQILL